jgi:hypothetical protein
MKEILEVDKGNKFNKMFTIYQQRHRCVEVQRFGDLLRLHHHDGCRELPAYPNDFDTIIKQPIPQAWFTDCVCRESFFLVSYATEVDTTYGVNFPYITLRACQKAFVVSRE